VHSHEGWEHAGNGSSLAFEERIMEDSRFYTLPKLPYEYTALAPYISEEQLKLHHQKHHQAYVNGANALFEKLDKARKENTDLDMKATLRELSFHIGGFRLHNRFWENLAPAGKGGGGVPKGVLAKAIDAEFGKFDRFKKEFTQGAASVEGSGWAALSYCPKTGRLLIMQIEKHNTNVFPGNEILMVVDVWEHAYYLDYKNDRAKFIDAFWNLVNWDVVAQRFDKVKK
jgi:Fe-Mn family superoxide dismutase